MIGKLIEIHDTDSFGNDLDREWLLGTKWKIEEMDVWKSGFMYGKAIYAGETIINHIVPGMPCIFHAVKFEILNDEETN